MSFKCVPQVTLGFCFQILMYFGSEHKGCLLFELNLENDEKFFYGFWI